MLIDKMEKDKKTEIVKALKAGVVTPVKFKIKKATNYNVFVLNVPFLLTVVSIGNFAKTFNFENTFWEKENILPNANYLSGNIIEILNPLPLIEWHCNITEYSYSNHINHPHLHKQEELLHISFIDNNFYENLVYKACSKKIMYIPLRKGLREIREIVLNPQDERGKELEILRIITVYLQLKRNRAPINLVVFFIGNHL